MSDAHTVVATLAMLDAEEQSGDALAIMLEASPPTGWPPENNDAATRAFFRALITAHRDEPGFGAHYVIADGALVGTCGFTGPPNEHGDVEIGYAVVPEAQRRGHATSAVRELLAFAFADARVAAVVAHTLPTGLASQKVLLANGFAADGFREDPEDGIVARFRAARPFQPIR